MLCSRPRSDRATATPRKRAHDRRLEGAEPRRRSRLATCARNTIAASDAPHRKMAASPLKRSRAADEPRCCNRREAPTLGALGPGPDLRSCSDAHLAGNVPRLALRGTQVCRGRTRRARRTTSDRVRKPIHHRTSRTFSSQGRTPQRTPSHLRCAMSSAMSPGYTNTTLSRRRPRSWGQRRRVSGSQLTLPTGQSAPLLLAQAFRKRAAARTWLPLRTKRRRLRGSAVARARRLPFVLNGSGPFVCGGAANGAMS